PDSPPSPYTTLVRSPPEHPGGGDHHLHPHGRLVAAPHPEQQQHGHGGLLPRRRDLHRPVRPATLRRDLRRPHPHRRDDRRRHGRRVGGGLHPRLRGHRHHPRRGGAPFP